MAKRDSYNDLKLVSALAPQTINTNTTTDSAAIDLAGYESVLIMFASGTIGGATADNVLTPYITECATSDGSFTAVADADLIGASTTGQEAAAAFNGTMDNTVTKIGYKGTKRYIKVSIVSTSTTTAGGLISANAILGAGHLLPVA